MNFSSADQVGSNEQAEVVMHADIDDLNTLTALTRFGDGVETEQDLATLRKGVRVYIGERGKLPLERCLRLPKSHDGWRRSQRDYWLLQAARHVDVDGRWNGAQKLEQEWNRFLTGERWNAWRDDEDPPAWATSLSAALFYATRYNRSTSLNAKQISRIAGHIFKEKCP